MRKNNIPGGDEGVLRGEIDVADIHPFFDKFGKANLSKSYHWFLINLKVSHNSPK